MKRTILLLAAMLLSLAASAQVSEATLLKREGRRNMTIKEWNTDARTQSRWLDHQTTYDDQGRKIEEIEFSATGQKERVTYKYDENGKVSQEVEYDENNKPVRIRKYEYNSDGTKKKQYNYSPKGKLVSVKVFEYIVSDPE